MTREIAKTARRLMELYGTTCPFALCDALGIRVSEQELPAHMNGFCIKFNTGYVIVLNNLLSYRESAYTCAHELGHILLHPDVNAVSTAHLTNLCLARYENEADYFAACLFIDPCMEEWHRTYDPLTLEQITTLSGLPEHVVALRFEQESCAHQYIFKN